MTVEDIVDVIGNFIESGKFGLHSRVKLDLLLADSFDVLPEKVKKAAEDAGGTKDNTCAVLHKGGSIWLIRYAHATRERLEKSIFHEVHKQRQRGGEDRTGGRSFNLG